MIQLGLEAKFCDWYGWRMLTTVTTITGIGKVGVWPELTNSSSVTTLFLPKYVGCVSEAQ